MEAVRLFRVRRGWTLEKMAGMLDLDISSLSRIERGKQALTPALAVKLEAMSKQKGLDLRAWVMAGLPDATKGGKKWKK